MEVVQLRYLITIVESDNNISAAAKKLYTSQSALSQVIINFEKEHNIPLFHREKGRLRELTPFGKEMYRHALKIVKLHDEMRDRIALESKTQSAILKIGVPELILTVYFNSFITQFLRDHPAIRLEIHEEGSKDLAEKLERHELDFAILVQPSHLNNKKYWEDVLIEDHLSAYMAQSNPLAQKESLSWEDLGDAEIALFNNDFITHQLISQKLSEEKVDNNIALTSSSWNFIMDICRNTEMITLFASEVHKRNQLKDLVAIEFKDPVPFNISLWSHKKDRKINIEEKFREELLEYTRDKFSKQ